MVFPKCILPHTFGGGYQLDLPSNAGCTFYKKTRSKPSYLSLVPKNKPPNLRPRGTPYEVPMRARQVRASLVGSDDAVGESDIFTNAAKKSIDTLRANAERCLQPSIANTRREVYFSEKAASSIAYITHRRRYLSNGEVTRAC